MCSSDLTARFRPAARERTSASARTEALSAGEASLFAAVRPPTLSVAAFGVFRSWSSNNHESSYHISGRFASGAGRFQEYPRFSCVLLGDFFAGRGLPAAAGPFRHHPRATQVIWPSSKISAYQRCKTNSAKVANLCPAGKVGSLPIRGTLPRWQTINIK